MAQSALTVFTPSPTPPTNLSFTGSTPPNPANFDLTTAGPYFSATGDQHYPRANIAPYFDDGINYATTFTLNEGGGTKTVFAANTAALTNGTSVANESAGLNEVNATLATATSPASRTECPTIVCSSGVVATATTLANGPNLSHASTLSGSAVPTITGAPAPNNVASGAGTTSITLTGTGYTRASVVFIDGIAQGTQYVSATSLVVPAAPKKLTSGTRSVTVVNGVPGGVTSAAATWTFT